MSDKTNEDIIALANPYVTSIGLENGEVWFQIHFDFDIETKEAHDAASDEISDLRESLKLVGLEAMEVDHDHDTVWGRIVATPLTNRRD